MTQEVVKSQLAPIALLRKARIFVSCLSESEAKTASRRLRDRVSRGGGDGLVVRVDSIRPYIERFIANQDAEVENNLWKKRERLDVMSGADLLAEKSGVNSRQIYGYRHGAADFMSLRNADLLLGAMGLNYLLSNGEIPVVKNPQWSWTMYRKWLEHQLAE